MRRLAALLAALALLPLAGCQTVGYAFDGAGYASAAAAAAPAPEVTPAVCEAHDRAADALLDEAGADRALGPEVRNLAAEHRVQAVVCRRLLELKAEGAAPPEVEARVLAAWARMWAAGLRVVGDQ